MIPYGFQKHRTPVASAPAVEARGLTVAYRGHTALRDVTFTLARGDRAAVVGANGAGKSTLLKAIAGLAPAPRDSLALFGHPVGLTRDRVAYLPQKRDLDWAFPTTVADLVMAGRYVHLGWGRRPGREDAALAAAALERVGLTSLRNRRIGDMSGGQQQRALLARALAQEAELFLLDEPFTALDAESRDTLDSVLSELSTSGATLVMATHESSLEERGWGVLLRLRRGEFVAGPRAGVANDAVQAVVT